MCVKIVDLKKADFDKMKTPFLKVLSLGIAGGKGPSYKKKGSIPLSAKRRGLASALLKF